MSSRTSAFVSCGLTNSAVSPRRAPFATDCERNVVFPPPGGPQMTWRRFSGGGAAVDEGVEAGSLTLGAHDLYHSC